MLLTTVKQTLVTVVLGHMFSRQFVLFQRTKSTAFSLLCVSYCNTFNTEYQFNKPLLVDIS